MKSFIKFSESKGYGIEESTHFVSSSFRMQI